MSFGAKKHGGGLGGLFGKESATALSVDLNITPLMDVMSNILFFLLAAFGSTVVAILPTTVPVRSTDTAVAEAQEEKVNVSLRADATGLTLKAESSNIDPALLKDFAAKLPKKGDRYDFEGLTLALKRIKEKYPASKSMVLVPDDDMKYQLIVDIMDAARDYKVATGHRIELFPEVVLSGLVK